MGIYDILPGGQQVKCWWCDMRDIKFGNKVPWLCDENIYSIALREGGYANITDCKLVSITDKPLHKKVFDKWGYPWVGSERSQYFFKDSEKG